MEVRYQTLYCHLEKKNIRRSFQYFCEEHPKIFEQMLGGLVQSESYEFAKLLHEFNSLEKDFVIFETQNHEPIVIEKKEFYDIEELTGLHHYQAIDLGELIEQAYATNH